VKTRIEAQRQELPLVGLNRRGGPLEAIEERETLSSGFCARGTSLPCSKKDIYD